MWACSYFFNLSIISQTHFSPSSKHSKTSNLTGFESALNIFALVYSTPYGIRFWGNNAFFVLALVKKNFNNKSRIKNAFLYTKDLMQKIWLFVLFGVFVGAFLHGYIPKEFFITYMGDNNIFAVPMAAIVGIPLYADATTIIPIAEVLIQKGAATGTVLVFMMAVVCLSLPEMIILSRVMKKELILRYVIFMFITFILVGYFYNFILQFFK